MIFTVGLNFYTTLWFHNLQERNQPRKALTIFVLTLIVDIGALAIFKYTNFILMNLNSFLHFNLPNVSIRLPIGISFYTFQLMSYVIDAYFGRVNIQKKLHLLLTYVAFFPQLIAGPIVRYSTIEKELEHRRETNEEFSLGFQRFILGLGKKVIIANNVAIAANYVFNILSLDKLSFTMAWLGVIAYTLQIYFDFSAYSDMAIGLGKMFGFNFLENFNYPYIATSITDFWRRWHMSLSTWFRDYVYIPLGGNRVSKVRWVFNLFTVWFLTGLWHGANWNFVLWGVYFGLILIIERLFLGKVLDRIGPIRYIYTLSLVMISWVLFNSNGFNQIFAILLKMTDIKDGIDFVSIKNARLLYLWPYFAFAILGSTPLMSNILNRIKQSKIGIILYYGYLLFVIYLSLMYLISNSYNPFIYFRF